MRRCFPLFCDPTAHHIEVIEPPYPLPNHVVALFVRRCAAASKITWEGDEAGEGARAVLITPLTIHTLVLLDMCML